MNRKLLTCLTKLGIMKTHMPAFVKKSRRAIYSYLDKNPLTEQELNSVNAEYEKILAFIEELFAEESSKGNKPKTAALQSAAASPQIRDKDAEAAARALRAQNVKKTMENIEKLNPQRRIPPKRN